MLFRRMTVISRLVAISDRLSFQQLFISKEREKVLTEEEFITQCELDWAAISSSNPQPVAPNLVLTGDQRDALSEIMTSITTRDITGYNRHLLIGSAGTGKTTLMQKVVEACQSLKLDVVLTAPTHKAVAVLAAKTQHLGVVCVTIHSLLCLQPFADGPKTKLRRRWGAKPVECSVVIIDECSMVDTELMKQINRHLHHVFVLFIGDRSQLPPVHEDESLTFNTASKSILNTPVRQSKDHPVLRAANVIRHLQTTGTFPMQDWCKRDVDRPLGVYLPDYCTDEWLFLAFTSKEFENDNDSFRYLCWTNARVAEINRKVRQWLYGNTIEPFSVGENVLIRAPIFAPSDSDQQDGRQIVFATNEEAPVVSIVASTFSTNFKKLDTIGAWKAEFPAWKVTLNNTKNKSLVSVFIPQKQEDYDAIDARLVREAKSEHKRWNERFRFAQSVAKLQSVYAMTTHNSQGSTYKTVFADVGDIMKCERGSILECQKLMYVASTRPTHTLILINTTR